jgi:anti-anti-sigma factor
MDQSTIVNERYINNGIIWDIKGDLTNKSPLLQKWQMVQPRHDNPSFLIINFSEIVYINSSGIALLIRVVRTAAKEGYRTFAYGISAHYQKLFKMVGLLEYMTIYPDEYAIMERIEYKLD